MGGASGELANRSAVVPTAPPPSDGMRWAHWPESAPGKALSPRQRQVIGLLATGMSRAEVAERLGIAPETVRYHVTVAFGRLNVPLRPGSRDRTLIAALNALGMITIPPEFRS